MTKEIRNSVLLSKEIDPRVREFQENLIWSEVLVSMDRYAAAVTEGEIVGLFIDYLIKGVFPPYLRQKYVRDSSFCYGSDKVVVYPHESSFHDIFMDIALPVIYSRYYDGFTQGIGFLEKQRINRYLNHALCKPLKDLRD